MYDEYVVKSKKKIYSVPTVGNIMNTLVQIWNNHI